MATKESRVGAKKPHGMSKGQYLFSADKIMKVTEVNSKKSMTIREAYWYEYLSVAAQVTTKFLWSKVKKLFSRKSKNPSVKVGGITDKLFSRERPDVLNQ